MTNDLYIILGYLILISLTLVLTYIAYKKIEISLFFYAISTWIPVLYFTNEEIWINTEIESGLLSYLRAGLLALVGIVGYYKYFINGRKNELKVANHFIFLGIFLLYSLISLSYSVDPRYTLIRISIFIFTFGFFLSFNEWLKNRASFERVFNLIFYFFILIFILTIITTILLPNRVWWWQAPNRFIGIGAHPADLGSIAMIFYPILLYKISKANKNQKIFLYSLFLSFAIMHIFTGSRTTLGASLAGFLVWLLLNRKWTKLLLSFICSIIFIIVLNNALPDSFTRSEGDGILSLSSRETIWEGAQKLFWEKPFIGYGYRVEARIFENQSIYDISDTFLIPSAQQPLHGGFISILLGGGLIGLSIWLLALLSPIIKTLRSGINELKAALIVIMVSILITNITETALTGYQSITDIFFWITWVMAGKIWKLEELTVETKQRIDLR